MPSVWSAGIIVTDSIEYEYILQALGPFRYEQSVIVEEQDTLHWTMGDFWGKRVFVVRAPQEWHAYAANAMRQQWKVKFIFMAGTFVSFTNGAPPVGHCSLQLPNVDERRADHLQVGIRAGDRASLAQLTNALDRFIAGTKEGQFNTDDLIRQWAAAYPELNEGLYMPAPGTYDHPFEYAEWPNSRDYLMCCSSDFNTGRYNNSIPLLKVLGTRGYRGSENDPIWNKYATLASAAAIAYILWNTTTTD